MKLKTNEIGFGNDVLLNIGYKLIPGGLIITAIGWLALMNGGVWYKASSKETENFIKEVFKCLDKK